MDAALFPDRPIKQPQRCSGLTAIEEAFRRGDGLWTRDRAGACFDKAEIQTASDRFIACMAAAAAVQVWEVARDSPVGALRAPGELRKCALWMRVCSRIDR